MTHLHDYWPTLGGALECACGHSLRPYEKGTPMTVPTNNEEREALAKVINPDFHLMDRGNRAAVLATTDDVIAWFAARRLPVSVDNTELITELAKQGNEVNEFVTGDPVEFRAIEAIQALSASQPREVEVTDGLRDLIERADDLRGMSDGAIQVLVGDLRVALVAALDGGDQR